MFNNITATSNRPGITTGVQSQHPWTRDVTFPCIWQRRIRAGRPSCAGWLWLHQQIILCKLDLLITQLLVVANRHFFTFDKIFVCVWINFQILKDITIRHKLLGGHRIHYKPGWDCHGLPIELKAMAGQDTRSLSPLAIRYQGTILMVLLIFDQLTYNPRVKVWWK